MKLMNLNMAILALLCLVSATAAEALVSYSATGWNDSDPNIVADAGPGIAGGQNQDAKSDRDLAQTFTLGTEATVDRVWVGVSSFTTGQSATMRLYSVTDPNDGSYPEPPVTPLFEELIEIPASLGSSAAGYLIFDIDGPTLGAGSYALQFEDSGSSTTYFSWQESSNSQFIADGRYYRRGSSSTDDRAFAIEAGPAPTDDRAPTTPEPATAALFALAAAALLRRRA